MKAVKVMYLVLCFSLYSAFKKLIIVMVVKYVDDMPVINIGVHCQKLEIAAATNV
jgi:hypothetical protein